jgi:phosphopantetheinyl transferase
VHPVFHEFRVGSVDVWSIDLDGSGLDSPEFRGVLSPDERRAGLAMPTALVRQRYLARKAFHRFVLADYLHIASDRISFSKGDFGKPGFASALRSADLQFSTSSSGTAAVIAVSRSVRVGIDIEAVRPIAHDSDVVNWVRDSFDVDCIEARPTDDDAFFRHWTRLEAQAKCSGLGLARHERAAGNGWNLKTLMHRCAGERFVLSLATRHSSVRVRGPMVVVQARGRSGCEPGSMDWRQLARRRCNSERRGDRA